MPRQRWSARRATIDLLCGTYDLSRGIRRPCLMGPDMKIGLALIAFSSFGLMRSLPAMAMAQTEQGFPSGIWMLQDETASLTTQSPPDRNYVNGLFIRHRIVPESTHRGPARCRCPAAPSIPATYRASGSVTARLPGPLSRCYPRRYRRASPAGRGPHTAIRRRDARIFRGPDILRTSG